VEANEKLIALVFNKYNLPDYQLGNIDEIMDINIFDDLGYDSIQFIELIVKIETEFGIEIDENILFMENFSTIAKIACIINEGYTKKGDLDDE
jgi:phosphopantetheine attachment domain protein